jgi:type I restriction enzyme S subunit
MLRIRTGNLLDKGATQMDSWKLVRADDLIDFDPHESVSKGAMTKKIAMEQLQPFTRDITAYEIAPFNGGSKFRNGDTLMARITPCLENGKTAQVKILDDGEIGFGSTEFIVMRAKPDISDKDFIYYLAMSPFFRDKAIKSMVGSSGRQRVQQGVLNNIELLVPSLEEQIEIGCTLRILDDKIANNNKINHHLSPQRAETDSSPDISRGKRESRRLARRAVSSRFALIFSKNGAVAA